MLQSDAAEAKRQAGERLMKKSVLDVMGNLDFVQHCVSEHVAKLTEHVFAVLDPHFRCIQDLAEAYSHDIDVDCWRTTFRGEVYSILEDAVLLKAKLVVAAPNSRWFHFFGWPKHGAPMGATSMISKYGR